MIVSKWCDRIDRAEIDSRFIYNLQSSVCTIIYIGEHCTVDQVTTQMHHVMLQIHRLQRYEHASFRVWKCRGNY